MAYITAIFDRDAADIVTRTSKAFFNITDWNRIEDNAFWVRDELSDSFGVVVIFGGVASDPTISFIPDVDNFNRLLEDIEQLRQVAESVMPALTTTSGFSAVAYDWVAGVSQNAPDYADVNHWEEVIDIIHNLITTYSALIFRYPRTGIATSGAEDGLIRQNMFRG